MQLGVRQKRDLKITRIEAKLFPKAKLFRQEALNAIEPLLRGEHVGAPNRAYILRSPREMHDLYDSLDVTVDGAKEQIELHRATTEIAPENVSKHVTRERARITETLTVYERAYEHATGKNVNGEPVDGSQEAPTQERPSAPPPRDVPVTRSTGSASSSEPLILIGVLLAAVMVAFT